MIYSDFKFENERIFQTLNHILALILTATTIRTHISESKVLPQFHDKTPLIFAKFKKSVRDANAGRIRGQGGSSECFGQEKTRPRPSKCNEPNESSEITC